MYSHNIHRQADKGTATLVCNIDLHLQTPMECMQYQTASSGAILQTFLCIQSGMMVEKCKVFKMRYKTTSTLLLHLMLHITVLILKNVVLLLSYTLLQLYATMIVFTFKYIDCEQCWSLVHYLGEKLNDMTVKDMSIVYTWEVLSGMTCPILTLPGTKWPHLCHNYTPISPSHHTHYLFIRHLFLTDRQCMTFSSHD